jgi:hypothetical protein
VYFNTRGEVKTQLQDSGIQYSGLPGTSRTLSENHTTRPTCQLINKLYIWQFLKTKSKRCTHDIHTGARVCFEERVYKYFTKVYKEFTKEFTNIYSREMEKNASKKIVKD